MKQPTSFFNLLLKEMAHAASVEEKMLIDQQLKEGGELNEEEKEHLAAAVLLEANRLEEIKQLVHGWESEEQPPVSRRIPWLVAAAIGGLILLATAWWLQIPPTNGEVDRLALQRDAKIELAEKHNLLALLDQNRGSARDLKRSESHVVPSPLDAAVMAHYFENYDQAMLEIQRTQSQGLISEGASSYLQAMCRLQQERFLDAKQLLEKVEEVEWEGKALRKRGVILIQLGKFAEAEKVLNMSLKKSSGEEQREVDEWLDRLDGFEK
ncbi:MAG: hypothetical protein AAF399_09690 [Bacteroidota bacterium]